jgi:hypothetical protein
MAARFIAPTLIASALLAGCAGVDPTFELEMARSEAQYLPIEVGATMALGVFKSAQFAELSASIQADGTTAGIQTDPPCVGIDLTDPMGGEDLSGSVRYDFSRCSNSGGSLDVQQAVLLPELAELEGERDIPEGWDGEIPEDWDGEIPTGQELEGLLTQGAAVAMSVDFTNFEEGLLGMSGTVATGGGVDGGALHADLSVSALDYGGDLDVDGQWGPGIDLDETVLSFAGEFVSSTELTWSIRAENIVLDTTCGDARGGELHATFSNDAGRVELRAVFSAECDGCATVYVNDVLQGDTCFDGSAFYGG